MTKIAEVREDIKEKDNNNKWFYYYHILTVSENVDKYSEYIRNLVTESMKTRLK